MRLSISGTLVTGDPVWASNQLICNNTVNTDCHVVCVHELEMEYCKKYCNSIAILTCKKVLQSVLLYFFNQVLLLLLQYFLPVLLTTLWGPNWGAYTAPQLQDLPKPHPALSTSGWARQLRGPQVTVEPGPLRALLRHWLGYLFRRLGQQMFFFFWLVVHDMIKFSQIPNTHRNQVVSDTIAVDGNTVH